MQLGTDVGYGSSFSTITLNIDFEAEPLFTDYHASRSKLYAFTAGEAADVAFPCGNYSSADNQTKDFTGEKKFKRAVNRRYVARLLMMEPEVIAMAENSCAVEQIRLQGAQVQQSIVSGAALVVSDKADDLEQYAS